MKKFVEYEISSGGEVGDSFEAEDMETALRMMLEARGTAIKEVDDGKKTFVEAPAKCPKCGCQKFYAHQNCCHDIIVDGHSNFLDDIKVYESDYPYGPYTCFDCGHKMDNLPIGES